MNFVITSNGFLADSQPIYLSKVLLRKYLILSRLFFFFKSGIYAEFYQGLFGIKRDDRSETKGNIWCV